MSAWWWWPSSGYDKMRLSSRMSGGRVVELTGGREVKLTGGPPWGFRVTGGRGSQHPLKVLLHENIHLRRIVIDMWRWEEVDDLYQNSPSVTSKVTLVLFSWQSGFWVSWKRVSDDQNLKLLPTSLKMANNIRGHFGNLMNILSTCFVWTNLHMYYIRIKSHFSYIFWSKVLPHLVHTFPVPLFSPEPPKQMFSPHLHNNCSVDCLCPKSVFKKDCGQFEMISSINISSNRRRVDPPLNLVLSSDQSSEPGQPGGESGIIPPLPSSPPSSPS